MIQKGFWYNKTVNSIQTEFYLINCITVAKGNQIPSARHYRKGYCAIFLCSVGGCQYARIVPELLSMQESSHSYVLSKIPFCLAAKGFIRVVPRVVQCVSCSSVSEFYQLEISCMALIFVFIPSRFKIPQTFLCFLFWNT